MGKANHSNTINRPITDTRRLVRLMQDVGRRLQPFPRKREDDMSIQVLVAYATKYGATAEIAEKIGQVLRQTGLRTNVLPVDCVSDPNSYKAVILGSRFTSANGAKRR